MSEGNGLNWAITFAVFFLLVVIVDVLTGLPFRRPFVFFDFLRADGLMSILSGLRPIFSKDDHKHITM